MRLSTLIPTSFVILSIVGCSNNGALEEVYTAAQKEIRGVMKHPSSVKFPEMGSLTEKKMNDSMFKYKNDSLEILSGDLSTGGVITGYCYAQNGFGAYSTFRYNLILGRYKDGKWYAMIPPSVDKES